MSELIAAVSTAPLPAAIGILRLSGPGAITAADRVFRAKSGGPLAAAPDRKLVYGCLLDREGQVVDQMCIRDRPLPQSIFAGSGPWTP